MLRQSRAPPQNGAIGIKRAYEAFNNDARNTWLEQLSQKIKQGRNPPEDPGPSRSPSPYETANEDLLASASNGVGELYAGEEEVMDELEGDDETDGQYDEDDDEEDDVFGLDDNDAVEVDDEDEEEEEELYEDEDSQGVVVVGEPVVAATAGMKVQRVTEDITLPRPSQLPPRTTTDAPVSAQTTEALAAFGTSAVTPAADEAILHPELGPLLADMARANPLTDILPGYGTSDQFIDPELLESLAQQLDSGIQAEAGGVLPGQYDEGLQGDEDVFQAEGEMEEDYPTEFGDQYDDSGLPTSQYTYEVEAYGDSNMDQEEQDELDEEEEEEEVYEGSGTEGDVEEEELYEDNDDENHEEEEDEDDSQSKPPPRRSNQYEVIELLSDDDDAEVGEDDDRDETQPGDDGDVSGSEEGRQERRGPGRREVLDLADSDDEEQKSFHCPAPPIIPSEPIKVAGETVQTSFSQVAANTQAQSDVPSLLDVPLPTQAQIKPSSTSPPATSNALPSTSTISSNLSPPMPVPALLRSFTPSSSWSPNAAPVKLPSTAGTPDQPIEVALDSDDEAEVPQGGEGSGGLGVYIPEEGEENREDEEEADQDEEQEEGSTVDGPSSGSEEEEEDGEAPSRSPARSSRRSPEIDELDADMPEEVDATAVNPSPVREVSPAQMEVDGTADQSRPTVSRTQSMQVETMDDGAEPSPTAIFPDLVETPGLAMGSVVESAFEFENAAAEPIGTDIAINEITSSDLLSMAESALAAQELTETAISVDRSATRISPATAPMSVTTAAEGEELSEEMTGDIDELDEEDDQLVPHAETGAAVDNASGALLSIPTAEEEEVVLEDMTADIDTTRHRPIRVEGSDAERDEPTETSTKQVEVSLPHTRHSPSAPLISVPTAEEEEQALQDMTEGGEERKHQPIMIDDEEDVPMPGVIEPREVEVETVDYTKPESSKMDDSLAGDSAVQSVDAPNPDVPINLGFADYILQPPRQVDVDRSSPVPMSLADTLPAEMTIDTPTRRLSPVSFPDPNAAAPDTSVPVPIEAGDMLGRSARSPSMEVQTPVNPPPANLSIDTITQPESLTVLPDPKAPPPDTDLPAPILPQNLGADDYTPTASVIAQAPDEVPALPQSANVSGGNTPRARAETPTILPNPSMPPPDARMEMPDVPHQVDSDQPVPASLIVHTPGAGEEDRDILSNPTSADLPTPPAPIIRDFAITSNDAEASSQLLRPDNTGDMSIITPMSEMEVELAVPEMPEEVFLEDDEDGIEVKVRQGMVSDEEIADVDVSGQGSETSEAEKVEEVSHGFESREVEHEEAEWLGEILAIDSGTTKDEGSAEASSSKIPSEAAADSTSAGIGNSDADDLIPAAQDGRDRSITKVASPEAEAEDSLEHEPLRHHHVGSIDVPAVETAAVPRRTRHSARTSISTEPAVTRSHCRYRKLLIVEDDLAANVLVPQCILGDTDRMSQEESADLGQPTAEDEKEARTRRITHDDPLLNSTLSAKLHRVVGASIFDEGHCFLLSASPGGMATDEIRQKTPQATPRRKGRQSVARDTPNSLRVPSEDSAEAGSATKKGTSNTGQSPRTRRSVPRLSEGASPASSAVSLGPRRSIRHARSTSRLSEVSSERSNTPTPGAIPDGSPAMNTRARSLQPPASTGSSSSIGTARDTTPMPGDSGGPADRNRRKSVRLSLEPRVVGEVETEDYGDLQETIVVDDQYQAALVRRSARSNGKGKADAVVRPGSLAPGSSVLDEGSHAVTETIATPKKPQSRRSVAPRKSANASKQDEAPYRPSMPEMAAERDDDQDVSAVGSPPPHSASKNKLPVVELEENVVDTADYRVVDESESTPIATSTRKRKNRLSTAGEPDQGDSQMPSTPTKRETRSSKRKAADDEVKVEGAEHQVEQDKQAEMGEKGPTPKKRKGWRSFLGL